MSTHEYVIVRDLSRRGLGIDDVDRGTPWSGDSEPNFEKRSLNAEELAQVKRDPAFRGVYENVDSSW